MEDKKVSAPRYEIPKTLSQSIYEHLKDSILSQEFEPNQRINEQEIAESFQVSRTPVREAVVRLAAEGFVEVVSHREALVREVSFEELKEVFQVIAVLDKLAAHFIADQIDSRELTKLEKMTNTLERHFIMREVQKFLDVNYTVHERLWDYLTDKNAFLQKELRFCVNQIRMCYYPLNRAFQDPRILRESMNAHKKILEALKEKNTKKLESVIYEHWVPPLP